MIAPHHDAISPYEHSHLQSRDELGRRTCEICAFISGCPDLYANHPERGKLLELREQHAFQPPDEVWICTSEGEKTGLERDQLFAWWRLLGQPFVLRTWTARATN